jgi:tellurite resistance protein
MHKNLAICHVIASVVSADGIMEEAERVFLEEAMEDLGLTPEEAKDVRDFKNEGAEDTVRAMPIEDKERLRDGLIAATLADGKISPHETAVVKHITELMGL